MDNLLAAVVLLVLQFVSTSAWALSQVRSLGGREPERDIAKARLWAGAASFGLLVVLIVAVGVALFTAGGTGLERITMALMSPAIIVGLAVCGIAALYPARLSVRIWRSQAGRRLAKVHLSLHVAAVYAVIIILLALRTTGG